jgi:NAD-dependent dihydropyrimidine dehydrogenase PreA subunit
MSSLRGVQSARQFGPAHRHVDGLSEVAMSVRVQEWSGAATGTGLAMAGLAIITEACIDVKDRACVDVCPVQCIYEFDSDKNLLFSDPDA